MPACKLALDAARGIEGSTMVVAMARNGTDFGIQVAGTGDEWFTGPAQVADGLFLGDYGPDDANPDIGDSAITETAGIGGFAMATAPAIVRLVGGSVPDALATTRRMHEITLGENPRWTVPVLEFQGTPTGIDVTRVCRTGILPQRSRPGRASRSTPRSAPATTSPRRSRPATCNPSPGCRCGPTAPPGAAGAPRTVAKGPTRRSSRPGRSRTPTGRATRSRPARRSRSGAATRSRTRSSWAQNVARRP